MASRDEESHNVSLQQGGSARDVDEFFDSEDGSGHSSDAGGGVKDLLANMEAPWANSRSFIAEMITVAIVASFTGAFSWGYTFIVGEVTEMWLSAVGKYDFPNDLDSVKLGNGAPLWIPICWAGGTLVGILKVILGLDVAPSFLEELQHQHVDPVVASKVCICCVVSLLSGAAMGPEAGLASVGGAFATVFSNIFCSGVWVRGGEEQVEERRRLFTLAGLVAAFGSILPAPWVALLLVIELSAKKADEDGKQVLTLGKRQFFILGFSASIAFIIRYQIEPIKAAPLPGGAMDYQYQQIMPVKAIGLGMAAGVIALIYFIIAGICKAIFGRISARIEGRCGMKARILVTASLAGLLTGVIGYFIPLALTDGKSAIMPTLANAHKGAFSAWDLVAIAVGKTFAYWIAASGGLVGGIFFPLIYIGMVVGELASKIEGLDVTPAAGFTVPVFMAALPNTILPCTFTLTALPISLFYLGPLWCVPIFVAQLSAYTCLGGTGIMRKLLERGAQRAA